MVQGGQGRSSSDGQLQVQAVVEGQAVRPGQVKCHVEVGRRVGEDGQPAQGSNRLLGVLGGNAPPPFRSEQHVADFQMPETGHERPAVFHTPEGLIRLSICLARQHPDRGNGGI